MLIYILTTTESDGIYIGQTVETLQSRFSKHKYSAKTRKYHIQNAMNRYGADTFSISLLETCYNLEELNYAEEFWISYFKSIGAKLYNIAKGGRNHETSDETRKKISVLKKGNKYWVGKKHSKETKMKMSITKKGKKQPINRKPRPPTTQATKNKISATASGKKLSEAHKLKLSKQIVAFKNCTEFNFQSLNAASNCLMISVDSIIRVLKGRQKQSQGYIFKYKDKS